MAYRNYSNANGFIVDESGNGDFTTISNAIAASTTNDTIFVRPGTYTENPTISVKVNIIGLTGDSLIPNVIINGLITISSGISPCISNIYLQNPSGSLITIGNSTSCNIYLQNCYFYVTANSSSAINIPIVTITGTVVLNLINCIGYNTSTGSNFWFIDRQSGTIILNTYNCVFNSTQYIQYQSYNCTQNIYNCVLTGLHLGAGNNTINIYNTIIYGNSTTDASCLILPNNTTNLTSTVNSYGCTYIGSSNLVPCVSLQALTSAITVFNSYADIFNTPYTYSVNVYSFSATSCTFNYANSKTNSILFDKTNLIVNPKFVNGGFYAGNQFSSIKIGCLGEQIRSDIPAASAITLTNNTSANVTSISLTPGIWDLSAIAAFNGTITGTKSQMSINNTSATLSANTGDQTVTSPEISRTSSDLMLDIPQFRVAISTTTTYYLVVQVSFTAGTEKSYGRLSATRVG